MMMYRSAFLAKIEGGNNPNYQYQHIAHEFQHLRVVLHFLKTNDHSIPIYLMVRSGE